MADDKNPFEASNRLGEITRDLDERGLVLTLAAFAEEALKDLLAAFMLPGKAADDLLEGFNAPLGSFSARIKAAAAFGLLTPRQQQNLDRLRRIRNEFAHSWEPVTFDDQAVSVHIGALHFIPLIEEFPTTRLEKVRTCISAALVEIRSTTSQIQKMGTGARTLGNHLVPGLIDDADRVTVCADKLSEIDRELPAAAGERQGFLLVQRERWLSLLTIYKQGARDSERAAIADLLSRHGPL